MEIDLVILGEGKLPVSWAFGKILDVPHDVQKVCNAVNSLSKSDGYVLFLDSELPIPDRILLETLISRKIDVAHAGPKLGSTAAIAEYLDIVAPISYFNLEGTSTSEYTSWKISLDCALVNKKILFEFPFLDIRYKEINCAALAWGYQLIWKGAIVRCVPDLVGEARRAMEISFTDGLNFIYAYYGRKWLAWSSIRLSSKSRSFEPLKVFFANRFKKEKLNEIVKKYEGWQDVDLRLTDCRVSIVIPTVDRYSYLDTLLNQLLKQSLLPYEVIVIDQTSREKRQIIDVNDFASIGLKVIYQETAGQCSSRNEGLRMSTGEYVLFLDDDDEVQPDLVERHLKCLSFFNADVSCGVCDEVGAFRFPKEYSLIRISDVFPTNNGMVKRSVLYKSGLFDLAYNRGQKADGDLGARIFKSGALMILNPEIRVLHHRAPSGGLRKHNVRKVTYSTSRSKITDFRLPHITELYFNRRFFSGNQQTEYIWLTLLGTFSIHKGGLVKIAKFCWALLYLPINYYRIRTRDLEAVNLINRSASIPSLPIRNE